MLGVIADDFTGATDIADVLVDQGFRTAVMPGLPARKADIARLDAAVVALKTRTATVENAVSISGRAHDALVAAGCDRFYFKYCSTFDSRSDGNIGPVIDELMRRTGTDRTVVVPAYPATGRTVYQGHLFVGDRLLSESSMRRHPLTPMRDSDLVALLRRQSATEVAVVPLQTVRSHGGLEAVLNRKNPAREHHSTAFVVDAVDEEDLTAIAAATADWVLLTGGAGLASALIGPSAGAGRARVRAVGRRLILSGSGSEATRGQVGFAKSQLPYRYIDLPRLRDDPRGETDRLRRWLESASSFPEVPRLIYACDLDTEIDSRDDRLASAIEKCFAELAATAVAIGFGQLLVTGGETSAAVTDALGVSRLLIGPSIAAGVPWVLARRRQGGPVSLALKSGNFGEDDLFVRAWEALDDDC